MKQPIFGVIVVLAVAGIAATLLFNREPDLSENAQAPIPNGDLVSIVMPAALGAKAQMGQKVFQAKCAACHGLNAQGVDGNGPPLIHKIYEPSHHGDAAFQRAPKAGVRSHHWPFGDMPPVRGVTNADIDAVISFVREVQRANGIL